MTDTLFKRAKRKINRVIIPSVIAGLTFAINGMAMASVLLLVLAVPIFIAIHMIPNFGLALLVGLFISLFLLLFVFGATQSF